MKTLLKKELALALHPTCVLYLFLSAMLLIPSYPYYAIFFYTTLGIFFVCLQGRETHDIEYSLLLPVPKRSIVRARILMSVILELCQMLISVPFAVLNRLFIQTPNPVGMDANTALFAFVFVLFGIFNASFFSRYYRAPEKVGIAFALSCVWVFLYIVSAETLSHIVPFIRDVLDTPDPAYMGEKLFILVLGALSFTALTALTVQKCEKSFAKLDF